MNYSKQDLIKYRLSKSAESLEEARVLAENGFYSTAVSRLYYSCFYAVISLLLAFDIGGKTHKGVNLQFQKHFIATGLLPQEQGLLYYELLNSRQEADYRDLADFTPEFFNSKYVQTQFFYQTISDFLKESGKI